jgi:hypothetical protein
MFAGSLDRESARAWKQQGGVHASNQSCIDHKSGCVVQRPALGQERLYNDKGSQLQSNDSPHKQRRWTNRQPQNCTRGGTVNQHVERKRSRRGRGRGRMINVDQNSLKLRADATPQA